MALHRETHELIDSAGEDAALYLAACEKAYATGTAVFVRNELRRGWSGALPIFVVYCLYCKEFTDVHPQGRRMRIECGTCTCTWYPYAFSDDVRILRVIALAAALLVGLMLVCVR